MKKIQVLIVILAATLGCASIVSKSVYPVTFDSSPSGADIVITDAKGHRIFEGRAPTTLTLSSKKGFFQGATYTIEATLEGREPGTTTLNAGLDGWYIGNLLFGGLIGMLIIDPATGAMWTLDERVVVQLGQQTSSAAPAQPTLTILSLEQVPAAHRDRLVPVE